MPTLFIDTHSEKVTMAVICADKVYASEKVSDRSHSEIAIPLLEEVLRKANIDVSELGEIVVVNGPGSFTGVRIGVTIAKTLAYSLAIPIKTITSLEMYGESSNEEFDVVTVRDAKGTYSALKVTSEYKDFKYQKKVQFEEYVAQNGYKVLEKNELDLKKVLEYTSSKEPTNSHKVNPVYIKEIDALK